MRHQSRTRRSKLEIYYDIVYAIQDEVMKEGEARPTRIAHFSNMSYDKMSKYIDELVEKNMITKGKTLSLTDKGKQFLTDYGKIREFIEKMSHDYL